MEKYSFHLISDPEYFGIVTILDYEIRLSTYLSKLTFPAFKGKRVLVDLALKSGLDEYRFIAFDIDDQGKIILDTDNYISVSVDAEKEANYFYSRGKILLLIHS